MSPGEKRKGHRYIFPAVRMKKTPSARPTPEQVEKKKSKQGKEASGSAGWSKAEINRLKKSWLALFFLSPHGKDRPHGMRTVVTIDRSLFRYN